MTEILPLGNLIDFGTAGSHYELIWQLGYSHNFEIQPRAWARLNDKVHLLHETTLSRLGEVDVLSNAQKPPKRVKENEETKK